jgi:hypothetical protein
MRVIMLASAAMLAATLLHSGHRTIAAQQTSCGPAGQPANVLVSVEQLTPESFNGHTFTVLDVYFPTGAVVTVAVKAGTRWHGTAQRLSDVKLGDHLLAAGVWRAGCAIDAADIYSKGETGFSLTLTGVPSGQDSLHAGTVITYVINHAQPAGAGATYQLVVPPGTTFMSARAVSGADVWTDVQSVDPVSSEHLVTVFARPIAPAGSVEVKVRVNEIWQGTVTAQARFLFTDLGASNTADASVALGDGVPGQVVASAFVDLNGDAVLGPDDIAESCPLWVYTNLTGTRVPDALYGPDDPRLPLVASGHSDQTGVARINLLPGRYAVLLGGCDVPLPPSGLPETTFDVISAPPETQMLSVSGAASYAVQIVDVQSTKVSNVIRAERPIGPSASPTDLRWDGLALTWVDNADGEFGYQVSVQSEGGAETFTLPANSTRFVIPSRFSVPCGMIDLQVKVAAVSRDAAGYPAKAFIRILADCLPQPVSAPNTGTGPGMRAHVASRGAGILLAAGFVLVVLGAVSLTKAHVGREPQYRS